MRRFFLTISILTLTAVDGFGQAAPGRSAASGTIAGAVIDADSQTPIASATVAIWNAADSSLATGAVAGGDGRFVIEGIRPGHYYVRISMVGYAPQTVHGIAIEPQHLNAALGTVRLAIDTAVMDEVEVTAERSFMEVHIDKNVYNTKDQVLAEGGSATDVLRNIPAVEVDSDGQISLRGSQNVAVLVNGRPSQMTGEMLASFLQGLPANTIDRVEVIPNPSARFEPDGMSGILNIVLKQDVPRGIGGSLTAGTGTQDKGNASGMFTFNQGPFSTRASYGFRFGTRAQEGTRFNEYRFDDPFSYLEVLNDGSREMMSHSVNLVTDYRLSARNSLSLSSMLSARGGDSQDNNVYSEWISADATTQYLRATDDSDRDLSADFGLSFRHIVDPSRHELTAEARFETEAEDESQHYRQEQFQAGADPVLSSLERSDMGERVTQASAQVDYLRPVGPDGKLEAGYKGSLQELDTDFLAETFDLAQQMYVEDPGQTNAFLHREQIHAAYGILGQQFGRIGVQAGVRLEQALTTFTLASTDTDFDNNYFSLFPSAFLTYKLSELHQLRLSYSKRINRPRVNGRFNQLSPLSDLSDPLFRRVGNPYLKPEYVHSLEVAYAYNAGSTSLTLSPYFRRTVDVIRPIDSVGEDGVTTVTFRNIDQSDSWGAEAIGSFAIGDRISAFASLNGYQVNTTASTADAALSNNAFGWAGRVNATFKLTPTLDMQASWFYRAPMDVEQGGRMGAMNRADLAFRQRLWGQKANLSVRVNDPLNVSGFQIERDTPSFYLKNTRRFDSRSVSATLTVNFGKQDSSRRRGNRQDQRPEGMDEGEMAY